MCENNRPIWKIPYIVRFVKRVACSIFSTDKPLKKIAYDRTFLILSIAISILTRFQHLQHMYMFIKCWSYNFVYYVHLTRSPSIHFTRRTVWRGTPISPISGTPHNPGPEWNRDTESDKVLLSVCRIRKRTCESFLISNSFGFCVCPPLTQYIAIIIYTFPKQKTKLVYRPASVPDIVKKWRNKWENWYTIQAAYNLAPQPTQCCWAGDI